MIDSAGSFSRVDPCQSSLRHGLDLDSHSDGRSGVERGVYACANYQDVTLIWNKLSVRRGICFHTPFTRHWNLTPVARSLGIGLGEAL
jgi:hypothetical protein